MRKDEPFWGWPGCGHIRRTLCYVVLVGLWFLFVYVGADYVTGLRSLRFRVHFDAELAIPFVPQALLIYNSVYLQYLIAPFVLRSRRALDAYAAALAAIIAAAGVGFLLLPAQLAYAPVEYAGAWAGAVATTRQLTLQYNLAPSLHVALAVATVAIFATRAGRVGRCVLWAWAIAVAASTLLLHQHHLFDAITGWPLGVAGKRLIYDRLSSWPDERIPPSPSMDPMSRA
jgi:membrane-associated phospholipid phosphatase